MQSATQFAQVLASQFFLAGKGDGLQGYKQQADAFVCGFMPGVSAAKYTPGGLFYFAACSNLQFVEKLIPDAWASKYSSISLHPPSRPVSLGVQNLVPLKVQQVQSSSRPVSLGVQNLVPLKVQQVVVEKAGGPSETYDDFTAALSEHDCRYGVFDFTTSDNCQKSKIFFIAWSPDTSRVIAKMMYASSKDQFRRELDGVHNELQATDPTEMDIEVIKEKAN